MLGNFLRSVLLEVHQFKQIDLIAFRAQDHFVFLTVEPNFKGNLFKCQVQNCFKSVNEFLPAFMVLVFVNDFPKISLLIHEGFPCFDRAFAEAFTE